ncbi:MAG: ImmA/IrrE family metallo-endopeptidase [Nitrososphaerales archaeon]
MKGSEEEMKASVVAMILDSRTEDALDLLSKWYRIERPRLGVGVVAGRNKGVAAVYSLRRKEILAANREYFYNPFVIIHEFYHHLRSRSGRHRGTEKEADRFAIDFIMVYQRIALERQSPARSDGDSQMSL